MFPQNTTAKPAQGIASLRLRSKWMDGDIKQELDEVLSSSEFRHLIFELDQMRYLFARGPQFSYRVLARIFGRSKSHIHTLLTATEPVEEVVSGSNVLLIEKRRGPSLLLEHEERSLIQWIGNLQMEGNCPTPRQVRDEATRLYEARTGEFHEFDRSWWKRFKVKHEDLFTTWVHAIEAARVEVSQSSVEMYFAHVMSALMQLKSPRQLVNLDEVGLCQRPDKGRRRRVVALRSIHREPTFQEEQDSGHVTMTAAVNLAGESLRPHFLGTSVLRYKDRDIWLLSDSFSYERTAKGRQTLASFTNYARTILADYVRDVRNELGDDSAKVYVIMDNATVHKIEDVLVDLGICPIWLPAHSSHFLQVLDLLVFAEFKKAYRSRRSRKTSPKIEGKLLRILSAWNVASYRLTIIKAWQRAGFIRVSGNCSGSVRFALSITRVHQMIQNNCADADQNVETLWLELSD